MLTARLRGQASDALISNEPPSASSRHVSADPDNKTATRVPRALRRCDGADIVKRNAGRKKRYLFAMPGGISIPAGARVGTLHDLDTSHPVLHVEFPEGVLALHGVLVFPRNTMLALKGTAGGRAKTVRCTDAFETIVVFAQWDWLGPLNQNPGRVPKAVPPTLCGASGRPVWTSGRDKAETSVDTKKRPRAAASALALRKKPNAPSGSDSDAARDGLKSSEEEMSVNESASVSDDVLSDVRDDDNDDDDSDNELLSNKYGIGGGHEGSDGELARPGIGRTRAGRANPVRAGRPDFSKMFHDSGDEDSGVGDSSSASASGGGSE